MEFLFGICNCMVDSDVCTDEFLLVLGSSHVCGHVHMWLHMSLGIDWDWRLWIMCTRFVPRPRNCVTASRLDKTFSRLRVMHLWLRVKSTVWNCLARRICVAGRIILQEWGLVQLKYHIKGTWNSLKTRISPWRLIKLLEICEFLLFILLTAVDNTKYNVKKYPKESFEENHARKLVIGQEMSQFWYFVHSHLCYECWFRAPWKLL